MLKVSLRRRCGRISRSAVRIAHTIHAFHASPVTTLLRSLLVRSAPMIFSSTVPGATRSKMPTLFFLPTACVRSSDLHAVLQRERVGVVDHGVGDVPRPAATASGGGRHHEAAFRSGLELLLFRFARVGIAAPEPRHRTSTVRLLERRRDPPHVGAVGRPDDGLAVGVLQNLHHLVGAVLGDIDLVAVIAHGDAAQDLVQPQHLGQHDGRSDTLRVLQFGDRELLHLRVGESSARRSA